MIGFAVIVGAFVSRPSAILPVNLLLGFVTGFSICAYSMAINDYYDVEVDRINQPNRPLPSGRLSLRSAMTLAIGMLVLGLSSALVTGIVLAVVVAVAYAFLSWIYNYSAKQFGLPGNAIVASSLAIPFIYGGVITFGNFYSSLLLSMALTSFLAGVGREVVKSMADTDGDIKRQIRSVPISHGMKAASWVGAALYLFAVVTSLLPVVLGQATLLYRVGVIIPDLIFIYLAGSILRQNTAENALRVKRIALMGMLVGLIVFIGGAF
jgi:geranylgeranylglycerol-phosphate geranylgeranyltransferase